jgi:hypothetical protein
MRVRSLLLVSMLASAGCGAEEPWTSGSKIEADVFDDDAGARTLIGFRVRATNRYCDGFDCGADVRFTETLRSTGIEGISMQGLEGDDGSWMFQHLYDVERGGPCTFARYGDTYRCGFAERAPMVLAPCSVYALACDPKGPSCREGALVDMETSDPDAAFYTLGAPTSGVPSECVVDAGCAGCEVRALTKTDPEALPELHTRFLGTGRYQVESWSNEDGSWTIPKQSRQLKDTTSHRVCELDRASPDAEAECR